MYIYKITNIKSGEVHEGSAEELSEIVNTAPNSVRLSCRRGQRVRNIWDIELLGDAADMPEHAMRLGLVKECRICGKIFTASRDKDLCCTPQCTKKNAYQHKLEWCKEQTEIKRSIKQPEQPKKRKKILSIAEINEIGRAESPCLSYGKVVAKYGL